MQSLIASFAAELTRKAQAEMPAAHKKFAQNPGGFRSWSAQLLQNFRGQLSTESFLTWARENPDELQQAIDGEAPAAVRKLDGILLEIGTDLDRAHQTEEAKKRPPKDSGQRLPPTAAEILAGHGSAESYISTGSGSMFSRPGRPAHRRP